MALVVGPTIWQFGTQVAATALGSSFGGGYIICKSGGVGWIVAPNTTEVSRTWYCRDDAVTTAQSITGRTGWFVPTSSQLQNPGYTCRTYWDSYSSAYYWSSTEHTTNSAQMLNFANSTLAGLTKTNSSCVRAFRCVTY